MSPENTIEKLVYQDKDGKEYEIYVEVDEPKIYSGEDHENDDPNDDGRESLSNRKRLTQEIREQAIEDMKKASEMMQGYAKFAVESFQEFGAAEVSEIMVEFGLKLGGQVGAVVTRASVDSTLKVQVKFKFPESRSPEPEQDQ